MDLVSPSFLKNATIVGHRKAQQAIQDAMKRVLNESKAIELVVPVSIVQEKQLLPSSTPKPHLLSAPEAPTKSDNVPSMGAADDGSTNLPALVDVYANSEGIKSIADRENDKYMAQLPQAEAPALPGGGGSIAEKAYLSNNRTGDQGGAPFHGDDELYESPSTELTGLEQDLFNFCTNGDCNAVLSLLQDEYGIPVPPDQLSDAELYAHYSQYFSAGSTSQQPNSFPHFPAYSTVRYKNEGNSYLGSSPLSALEHPSNAIPPHSHFPTFPSPQLSIHLPLHDVHRPDNGSTPLHALCSSSAVIRAEQHMRTLWRNTVGRRAETSSGTDDDTGVAGDALRREQYFPFFPQEWEEGSPITLLHRTILALLLSGIPVNALSGNGSTPLHWCAGSGSAVGSYILLEYGANPLMRTYTWRREVFGRHSGQTPFHWASESDHPAVLYTLSEYAPVGSTLQDERSMLPLELAQKTVSLEAESACRDLESEQWIGLRFTKESTTTGIVK